MTDCKHEWHVTTETCWKCGAGRQPHQGSVDDDLARLTAEVERLREANEAWRTWEIARRDLEFALAAELHEGAALECECKSRQRLCDLGEMEAVMAPAAEEEVEGA